MEVAYGWGWEGAPYVTQIPNVMGYTPPPLLGAPYILQYPSHTTFVPPPLGFPFLPDSMEKGINLSLENYQPPSARLIGQPLLKIKIF